jgi:hypothetical protein
MAALVYAVQCAALLLYFAAHMPEHMLPTRWPRLGHARSRLADALEALVAAMLFLYTGGVALTPFSDTLLYDPSARVPFFASLWMMVSLLYVAIAHKAAGKGTWAALVTRPLALCIIACALPTMNFTDTAQFRLLERFVGLFVLIMWASPVVALMGTRHRAFSLIVFVGWPTVVCLQMVLLRKRLMTPAIMWSESRGDDTFECRLLVGTSVTCCFQSFQLLACICVRQRLPRHLPHERPKLESARHGGSPSVLVMLALTGVVMAFIYPDGSKNFLTNNAIVSPHGSTQTISAGSERHLLSRMRLVLSESPNDRAALWGMLAASVVGALLVVSRVSRMRSQARLSQPDGTLEVRRLACGPLCFASSTHAKHGLPRCHTSCSRSLPTAAS